MIVVPLLAKAGWVGLSIPPFYPLGAALGGYLFGLAMAWAGGCAAGVWYKWGGGNWGTFTAVLGLVLGAGAAEYGPLRWLREQVQSVWAVEEIRSATLGGLSGAEWVVYPLGALLLLWLARSRVTAPPGFWSWPKTGILLGLLGIAAWPLSALSGRAFGMAIVPGSVNALEFISRGDPSWLNWDVFFVLAIPAGAYLAVRQRGEMSSDPVSGTEAAQAFVGGLLLGIGASLAGGCTVGHSLVGLPLLSVGSLVTTLFIILGSWTVGYFDMRAKK
jgi:uncharacterized membrane protein YedE/YeeE